MIVDGIDQVVVRFAKCCSPQLGEPIVGYITQGRGVTVHHQSCPQISLAESARLIQIAWNMGNQIGSSSEEVENSSSVSN